MLTIILTIRLEVTTLRRYTNLFIIIIIIIIIAANRATAWVTENILLRKIYKNCLLLY